MRKRILRPFVPQDEFTRIHNYVLEEIMPKLPGNAWKILSFILRKTTGWQGEQTQVSYGDIKRGTGIVSDETVSANLKVLLGQSDRSGLPDQPLIIAEKAGRWDCVTYRLNCDLEVENPHYDNRSGEKPSPTTKIEVESTTKIEVPPYIERKIKETGSASEKQTRRKTGVGRGKRGALPTCRIETDILCPPDFLTPELRAWAEREMPPVTLARFDSLLEQFLCDHREVKRDRLADAEAWRSRFKNFLRGCRDNDLRAEERRGRGYSSGAPAEESSPSFDTLFAAGIVGPELPAVAVPVPASAVVAVPLNPKHTF